MGEVRKVLSSKEEILKISFFKIIVLFFIYAVSYTHLTLPTKA